MADFATVPELEEEAERENPIQTDKQAAELVRMLDAGEIPAGKAEQAWADLARHRRETMGIPTVGDKIAESVFGVFTRDPSEFGEVMSSPAEEFGRQILSVSKGIGEVAYDTAIFSWDAAEFALPDMPGFLQANDYAHYIRARAKQRREEFKQQTDALIFDISEKDASPVGEFVGQVAPFFALPTQMSTYTRTVLYNASVGGLAGFIFDKDAKNFTDRIGDAQMGALWGLGASGVLSARQGFQRYASRRFLKSWEAEHTQNNLRLEKTLQEMGVVDRAGDPINFSLSELTADPFITGLTVGAAHTVARDAQNAKIKMLVDFINKRSQRFAETDPVRIASDVGELVVRLAKEIKTGAAAQYGHSLDNLIATSGDDLALTFAESRTYLEKAQDLAGRLTDPREHGHLRAVPKGLQEHISFLDSRLNPVEARRILNRDNKYEWHVFDRFSGDTLQTFSGRGSSEQARQFAKKYNFDNGGLLAEDVERIMVGNTKLASGELSIFETAGVGSDMYAGLILKKAMIESLEGTDTASGKIIMDMREQYASEMKKLIAVRRNLLGSIFEKEDGYVNAVDAVDALVGRSPKEMRDMRKTLEGAGAGDLVDDMKAYALSRAVEKATSPETKASLYEVDLVKLAKALAGPKSNEIGGLGRGFFTAAEQAELVATGQAVRVLRETYMTNFGFASVTEAGNITINVVSRSPEFFAREMSRMLGKSDVVAHMLNDAGARRAIVDLAQHGPDGKLGRLALATLKVALGEIEGQKQVEEERRLRTEALEETGRSGSARLLDE